MNQPSDANGGNPHAYALYIDETGAQTPGLREGDTVFGLGGVLVKRDDEAAIRSAIRAFKKEWAIPEDIPFHGAEIRAENQRYHWLSEIDVPKKIEFKTGLLELIISLPVVVHACIVDRSGYFHRYNKKYGRHTWAMSKSAAAILIERAAKYVISSGGKSVDVYFELCGRKEDAAFKKAYEELLTKGHPFDVVNAAKYGPLDAISLASVLAKVPMGRRKDNEILQIADLCLFPVATSKNGKSNRAFERFISDNKLIDCLVGENVETLGVKYYCFDK